MTTENTKKTQKAKANQAVDQDINFTQEMRLLARSEEENNKLLEQWKKGQKTTLAQALDEEVEQDEKPAVGLYDDRNQERPDEAQKKHEQVEELKPKPSQRGTKFGADLIPERWATFEQSQAKALDGIRELELKRDGEQAKLDEFNEKHGDYLSKSIKQATGGDLGRMAQYKKLREQQDALQKGVDVIDKSLEQSRDRYQRDHHEFHADAWGRVRQQGEVIGNAELIAKADSMAKHHTQTKDEHTAKLPAEQQVQHTRSVTAQKVEERARLSEDLKQRAEHDPELKRDIDQGREQVEKIGQDTAKRREERQQEHLPNHKHKQSM